MSKPIDYDALCTITRKFILEAAKAGGETPTVLDIAQLCGCQTKPVTEIFRRLEKSGRVEIIRRKNRDIRQFRIAEADQIYATKIRPASYVDNLAPAHFGARPIAMMQNRDEAERLIAMIFRGGMSERAAQKIAEQYVNPKSARAEAAE